ncbi:MAG TPA: hypothetical protein VFV34_15750 [Blastocatellia bacterium]|nr:hypothetical protein [Blastocatellia bacterium]
MEQQPYYGQVYNQQDPSDRPRRRVIVYGCVGGAVLIVAIGLTLGVKGWRAFVQFGVAKDLSEYHAKIASNDDLDEQTKRRLLDGIDGCRARVREKPIGFLRWMTYSESFEGVLNDGTITPEEVRILDRELDRLEKELGGVR